MAITGHSFLHRKCPLSGGHDLGARMSAFDSNRPIREGTYHCAFCEVMFVIREYWWNEFDCQDPLGDFVK
jgi:hypothetical protein